VQQPLEDLGRGSVLVACAGTSDLAVAREAANTARMFQNRVVEIADIGVAGLHRLLAHSRELREAAVIIVVAAWKARSPR